MPVTSSRERNDLVNWLAQVFAHLPHSATFRAIRAAADAGLEPETLRAMVDLRLRWIERSEWWVGRYGASGQITSLRHGPSALTWVLARRICEARADYPPEAMIEEEWLDEWSALRPGEPGYLSFAAYVAVKVSGTDEEALHEGFALQQGVADGSELGDQRGWYRRLPDPDDIFLHGIQPMINYDERPGPR
jgi:hypothetical protein